MDMNTENKTSIEDCIGCRHHKDGCINPSKCATGDQWEPADRQHFGMTCHKCKSLHGKPPSMKIALDIVMDSQNDLQCRLAARHWIEYIFRKYVRLTANPPS